MGYDKEKQREYARQHYQNNKDLYKIRDKKRRAKGVKFLRRFKQLKTTKCIDCGESRWQCLDFDHVDPSTKNDTVCRLVRNRVCISTIKKEIRKCDIVCANCHRIRHNGCAWEDE